MRHIGIDFGTGNTVIAIWNETLGRAGSLIIDGISTPLRYRLTPDGPEQEIHVVPSMIHYSETEVLIGNQVLTRGMADHSSTMRWMKRGIGAGQTRRTRTSMGFKSPAEAGQDFLTLLIRYAAERINVEEDEFTFTAPCEAFENYQDWLRTVAEGLGIRRLRFLDEPTAAVSGYQGAARKDDVFVVFDFGCGTLDVSAVRIDFEAKVDRKAVQLGQAGDDLGGMDIDHWVADDFATRHGLNAAARSDLLTLILRGAESLKIALSDPDTDEASIELPDTSGPVIRLRRTRYTRTCPSCDRGQPGNHAARDQACLGCLLLTHDFLRRTEQILDRALENAAIKGGVRKSSVTRVLVTGGTSLVPSVRALLDRAFPGKVEYGSPFDAVARGACKGLVDSRLAHDYAIESYNSKSGTYEFMPLFESGTEYPTDEEVAFWANVAFDGQTRMAPKIFEVSQVRKRDRINGVIFDEHGDVKKEAASKVRTEMRHQCLNDREPTYIIPKPPVMKSRDGKRFRLRFTVDGQRRLLLTVEDHHPDVGGEILTGHPVVRL